MVYYLFFTASFIALLISDYLQILQKKFLIIVFSISGYGGIVMTLLILSVRSWNTSGLLVFLILKVLFLIFSILLLVYLLFFEIPLSPQFKETEDRKVINHGSYGIVRHPAFYPFLLVTIALSLIVWDWDFVFIAFYLNILNFLLIAMEDLFLFPKIFINYREYKKQVPFLFPKLKFRFKKV